MRRAEDLTGRQFHYLTVLYRVPNKTPKLARWRCRCICGQEVDVNAQDLKHKGHSTKSCGCMKAKLIGDGNRTHGMSKHPAWAVWHSMKQRCLDPTHEAYHNYGGRGITICTEWLNSFEAFWRDMGPTYQSGLDLDRIDNNKGYSPDNCHWATRKANNRNNRTNRVIETPMGIMTVSELSERTGIGETTLLYRLDHGWPTESLCAEPDAKNRYTTSGIAARGTGSPSMTQQPGAAGS